MTTVEITVRVSIRPEGMSLQEVEEAVGVAVGEAGRDLLRQGCQALEDSWLERQPVLGAGEDRLPFGGASGGLWTS